MLLRSTPGESSQLHYSSAPSDLVVATQYMTYSYCTDQSFSKHLGVRVKLLAPTQGLQFPGAAPERCGPMLPMRRDRALQVTAPGKAGKLTALADRRDTMTVGFFPLRNRKRPEDAARKANALVCREKTRGIRARSSFTWEMRRRVRRPYCGRGEEQACNRTGGIQSAKRTDASVAGAGPRHGQRLPVRQPQSPRGTTNSSDQGACGGSKQSSRREARRVRKTQGSGAKKEIGRRVVRVHPCKLRSAAAGVRRLAGERTQSDGMKLKEV